jgi:HEAT repeat protein
MGWVALIAVLLAVGRYPFQFIETHRRFAARMREDDGLVQSYYTQCAASVNSGSWREAVTAVQIAWCNIVFSPEHIGEDELDAILTQLRGLAARATPQDAEGDLYLILDLLAHANTKSSIFYLSGRREALKREVLGYGLPSGGLVDYALSWAGPHPGQTAVAVLGTGLNADDWRLREAGCRALGQFGLGFGIHTDTETALSGLRGAPGNDDHLVREIAVECLREIGFHAARARDALIEMLRRDPSIRVRAQAAITLSLIESDAKVVVPALIAGLQDSSRSVRCTVIKALAELGEKAAQAVPELRGALHDADYEVRRDVMQALGNVECPSGELVGLLVKVVKTDLDEPVRGQAAATLGEIGPAAIGAVPSLIAALKRDNEPGVRRASALALARIGPADPTVHAALARTLEHDEVDYMRAAAAGAIGQIGPPAASAIPALLNAAGDPEGRVRTAVAEALGHFGPQASQVLPTLIGFLKNKDDWWIQKAALESLGAFGPEARQAIPAIEAIRQASPDDSPGANRAAAATALAKINPHP